MTAAADLKDLVVLTADKNTEFVIRGLLSRIHDLGLRTITWDIHVHPEKDPGCLLRAHEFLRSFAGRYRHALVLFDREGCGQDRHSRFQLEVDVQTRLASSGWSTRSTVVVLDPEIEAWVWSDSRHVDSVLGWTGRSPDLRAWLRASRLLAERATKPDRPKESMEAALYVARIRRSSALYEQLARKVGLERCTDEAFGKLRATLTEWFAEGWS